MFEIINPQLDHLQDELPGEEIVSGEILFNSGACQILSQSSALYELVVTDEENEAAYEYAITSGRNHCRDYRQKQP